MVRFGYQLYTDEDFAKMRELAANRKAEQMAGVKRSHAQELMDEDADSDNENAQDPDRVDVRRITSGLKKKQNYEERMASIREGREGRDKFGSKMGQKKLEHGGSKTNKEKSKGKNMMMMVHKRSVKSKAKRSLREKQVCTLLYFNYFLHLTREIFRKHSELISPSRKKRDIKISIPINKVEFSSSMKDISSLYDSN